MNTTCCRAGALDEPRRSIGSVGRPRHTRRRRARSSPPEDFGNLTGDCDGGFIYTAKDGTRSYYAVNGALTQVVDPHGLEVDYTYDDSGRLTAVDTPDGGQTHLVYDDDERLSSITEPGGRQWSFRHAANADLEEIQSPVPGSSPRVLSYALGNSHLVTGDAWGPLGTSFGYDAGSGLLTSVDRGGEVPLAVQPAALAGRGGQAITTAQA